MGTTIERDKVYTEYELRIDGLFNEAELKRARASGLKSKEIRRGKRIYRGSWLIAWMEGRERITEKASG